MVLSCVIPKRSYCCLDSHGILTLIHTDLHVIVNVDFFNTRIDINPEVVVSGQCGILIMCDTLQSGGQSCMHLGQS